MMKKIERWPEGQCDLTVLMITLNECHNLQECLDGLKGWAKRVILVDSFSTDGTVELAKSNGVDIIQRSFTGFGDQWEYAANATGINTKWAMKLDPDERIGSAAKKGIAEAIEKEDCNGFIIWRRLWFMGRPTSVRQKITRVWKAGTCRFEPVLVNEHPIIDGDVRLLDVVVEHLDSPDLEHWIRKQNRYTTDEAISFHSDMPQPVRASLRGSSLQKRMWLKKHFFRIPCRYLLSYIYFFICTGAFRCGFLGHLWARQRVEVLRLVEYKKLEMEWSASRRRSMRKGWK